MRERGFVLSWSTLAEAGSVLLCSHSVKDAAFRAEHCSGNLLKELKKRGDFEEDGRSCAHRPPNQLKISCEVVDLGDGLIRAVGVQRDNT